MITKADILERAAEWHLDPQVVEKDYVLGWLLAAIGADPEIREAWVFKGGTCLKKCYLETYRFSEDLDFSLRPGAPYDSERLTSCLRRIAGKATELSGIRFAVEDLVVQARENKAGQRTFEVRLGFSGPLAVPGPPKVRLDLTMHEVIAMPPERRAVFHAYPDAFPAGTTVAAYPLTEVLAEKLRALVERSRPRDLYDVVYVLENEMEQLDLDQVRSIFLRKCHHKELAVPTSAGLDSLVRGNGELLSEWDSMLKHQLPALPPVEDVLSRLARLTTWLDPKVREAPAMVRLESALLGRSSTPLATGHGGRYWGLGTAVEVVRFAGANRLVVSFNYHGKHRLVEPYSIRNPAGNLLLYAWELQSGQIKAFKVAEMRNASVTSQSFTPRFRVEFFA